MKKAKLKSKNNETRKRSEKMENQLERIKAILKDNGYKMTPQRLATIESIIENEGKHMSTEEIYDEVKNTYPEIGLATVYRTMILLEELGILNRHNFDDGRNRYELSHSNEDHHHHHLICMGCGKVMEVEGDLLESLEETIQKKNQFKVVNHKVQFFGYCKDCQ